jgi:hypothetical protein
MICRKGLRRGGWPRGWPLGGDGLWDERPSGETRTDDEWQRVLTPEQYEVTRARSGIASEPEGFFHLDTPMAGLLDTENGGGVA